MRPPRRFPLLRSLLLALMAPGAHAANPAPAAASAPPDFLRDVRPVLAAHCFKCHGPDDKARKGGLRLDGREEVLKPAKSGAPALVPGKPEASELVKRVFTEDEDELMPPSATKHPLSPEQKETLRRWVAAGAEYQPHWAFVVPQRPAVPVLTREQRAGPSPSQNPIDHFIRVRLAQEGLKASVEADRPSLVRRVSLDLIGLPPTPEEVEAFVNDTQPNAYERLVERLLASEHYGERWARRWMDLARYSDTNGYEKDRPRSMWPWRDWVIRAFNEDLGFDQFTIQQIAGDLLPGAPAAREARFGTLAAAAPLIATGFHRNTMINEEGGVDPLEFRYYSMVDRVHTTATTWLGLTLSCAQCHTHKYDPIQQREYFQFMAFLDNADEPTLDVPDPAVTAGRKEIEDRMAELVAGLPARFPPEENLLLLTPTADRVGTEQGGVPERLSDGSYRFGGPAADQEVYTFEVATTATNLTLLNLDALADDALPKKGPGRSGNGNFVLSEITVEVAPLEPSGDSAAASGVVKIASASADFEQGGFPVKHAFDGKEDTGWAVSGEGAWNINRRATFRFEAPVGFPGGTRFTVRLVQRHGARHVLGRVRLSLGAERPDSRSLEDRRREHFARRFEAWKQRELTRVREWVRLRPIEARSQVPVLTVQDDDSVFVTSDMTKSDTYELGFRTDLKGITALRLEALPDDRLPRQGPGRVAYEGPFGDFFLSTFAVSAGGRKVKLIRASQTHAAGGSTAERAIDEDQQSGWSIDGGQGRTQVAVFNLETPLDDASDLRLSLLFEKYYAAGLGRFRISVTTDPRGAEAIDLADDLQLALRQPAGQRSNAAEEGLVRRFAGTAPELATAREEIEKLRRSLPSYPTTLVLQERPADNPRATVMRHRGEFLQPTDPVTAGLPAWLEALTPRPPRNRLEFARWLVSRDNPLTARVTMNRQWGAFFGRGLVRTTEDFGFQGELPSHPELLDWLAVEFMESGWSLKAINRVIVLSATYRQSARVTPELLEKDPQNRLLARAPRFRLEGELVRDLALAASSLLSPKVGGPSVFPPQLASITKEGAYGPLDWVVSPGEDRYRRGVYTFAKRTMPYATFNLFDAPSGEACSARREVSNTPLQSLVLLNDEVFFEVAQALGRQAAALDGDEEGRVRFLFLRLLSRPPQAEEAARTLAFFRAQLDRFARGELPPLEFAGKGEGLVQERAAWTAVARALLNLDETMTRG